MSFDLDKITYQVDGDDTNGGSLKVDVFYAGKEKGSVRMAPKDMGGAVNTVVRKLAEASVPLARALLAGTVFSGTEENLSLQLIDNRKALLKLEEYLTNKGTYVKADPLHGPLEFVVWMRTKFTTLDDQQIVDAMTE